MTDALRIWYVAGQQLCNFDCPYCVSTGDWSKSRRYDWTDPADREKWHELSLTVDSATLKTSLDGAVVLEYTLGTAPGPGRNGAPPNPDLFPENNPVLRPPVNGKVGLWSKTDSTSYFKDYVVIRK